MITYTNIGCWNYVFDAYYVTFFIFESEEKSEILRNEVRLKTFACFVWLNNS